MIWSIDRQIITQTQQIATTIKSAQTLKYSINPEKLLYQFAAKGIGIFCSFKMYLIKLFSTVKKKIVICKCKQFTLLKIDQKYYCIYITVYVVCWLIINK